MSEQFPAAPTKPSVTESARQTETEPFATGLVGLQTRLQLQGAALDPSNKNVPEITQVLLGDPKQRDDSFYTVFNEASVRERTAQTISKDQWVTDNNIRFAKSEHKDKMQKLSFLGSTKAEDLYDRYLKGTGAPVEVTFPDGTKKFVPANVKQFFDDVMNAFSTNGALQYDKLQGVLNEIQWIAHIFGDTSAKLITQLIDGEAKLLIQPQQYIDAANATSNSTARRNDLTDTEVELLNPLFTGNYTQPMAQITTPATQSTDSSSTIPQKPIKPPNTAISRGWKYKRLEGPADFPDTDEIIVNSTNPHAVAQSLKDRDPNKYRTITIAQLADKIKRENSELEKFLADVGLDEDSLHEVSHMMFRDYDEHLRNTFNIPSSSMTEIQVVPIDGHTADLYDPKGNVAGFIKEGARAMFINMKLIKKVLQANGKPDGQGKFTIASDVANFIIQSHAHHTNIHEYTHLRSQAARWVSPTDRTRNFYGRLGLEFGRFLGYTKRERGRWFMEGLTEKLTRDYFEAIGKKPNYIAYQQEQTVLDVLFSKMQQDDPSLDAKQALQLSADAYFRRDENFTNDPLVKLVSAVENRAADKEHQKPHAFETILDIMDYEHGKSENTHYPLTLAYIRGRLTDSQKQMIQKIPMSEAQKKVFANRFNLDYVPPRQLTPTSPTPDNSTESTPQSSDYSKDNLEDLIHNERRKRFADYFRTVKTPTNRNKAPIQEYLIDRPPSSVSMTQDQLRSLQLPLPYFLFKQVGKDLMCYPNPAVAPFTRDFMDNEETKQDRFYDLTRLDKDDSSLRALAGTIAPTPEAQAQVYDLLVDAVLKVHENDPSLLKRWIAAQFIPQKDMVGISSADQFVYYDSQRSNRIREGLFYVYSDAVPATPEYISPEKIFEIWEPRLKGLRSRFSMLPEEPDHRQLEMLAHSVDVKGIVEIIKSQA